MKHLLYHPLDGIFFLFLYLGKFGYSCSFGNNKFSLFQNSNLVGTGSLSYVDNLYMLDTIASYHETFQLSTRGVKRKLTNENSSSL